ncbi:MAG TPA: MMPL family transporter [Conexibacter sp.]
MLATVTIRNPDGSAWIARATRLVQRQLGRADVVQSITQRGSAIRAETDPEAPGAGTALIEVMLRVNPVAAEPHVASLRSALARADSAEVETSLLGPPVLVQRYAEIARSDLSRAERLAVPLTALVLLIAFQAVVAALLPVLLAVATMVVTFACLAVIGAWIGLSVFVTNTATILALGLSIDYSLFMVTRYREELARSDSIETALTITMVTTGRAVLLSACTIAASLVGLFVVGISTFSTMAIGATIATIAAGATALTLLPATIRLIGHRIEWLRIDPVARAAARATLWSRLAGVVTRRPVAALLSSLAVLLALAVPATSFRLDVHTQRLLPRDDDVRRDMASMANAFYPGTAAPIMIVTRDDLAHVKDVVQSFPGIAQVSGETMGRAGWSFMQAIPATIPDEDSSRHTVERLRTTLAQSTRETHVGGTIATSLDLTNRIANRAPRAILIAISLCFLVFARGVRSLVIPLKAVLTTLLSVAATLGLLLRLFDQGAGTPHLEFFVPLFIFAILFGLSVDYEVFLLSRIREAVNDGHDHREAVRRGLVGSARSITLAGLTLMTVFLAFATSRLLPFQQLGIGLALGVMLDITIVRCVLVPAAVVLLRSWNWWWPWDQRPSGAAPADCDSHVTPRYDYNAIESGASGSFASASKFGGSEHGADSAGGTDVG